jgi:putative restriction endonuclease
MIQPTPPEGSLQDEIFWRGRVYELIKIKYPPCEVPSHVLQELGVYRGQAGLWCDRERTTKIIENGLCVSLLHTGKHYADSLQDSILIYHYPQTSRPGSTDANEIQAARECLVNRIPLFIIFAGMVSGTKEVRLGWLVGDMPDERAFLVSLQDTDPGRVGSR